MIRVISWNMAYWTHATFKTHRNRQRQWAFLVALAPDVALLQECRPGDFSVRAPAWAQAEYEVVGSIPPRWTGCSAILARRSFNASALDLAIMPFPEQRWLSYLSGYV